MGILLALAFSAFFSGIEIAFYSANKLRIAITKNKGTLSARLLAQYFEHPSKFLTTLLIGNNIALVVFGSLMATVLGVSSLSFLGENVVKFFNNEPIIIIYQTIITTIIVLIFGEFLPKILFKISPSKVLTLFAVPLKVVYVILYPLTWVFDKISTFIIALVLGKDFGGVEDEISAADLEHFVKSASTESETEDEADDLNTEFFEKALYLKDVKVRECMVPRTEVEAISIDETVETLREKFIESKLSRIVLYNENIDQIIGYTHHFELLKKPQKIESIMFTMPMVPESMSARDLLTLFTKENRSIAWVVDEYGGTAGIVTLEDVIEEIFGEIHDEHDSEEHEERKVGEHEYVFSGRLEIDYLNEKYELDLPTGEYETIAGYVVVTHEDIPEPGSEIVLDNFKITILKASDNRIETVRLKVL
ncbi:MAG: HlyC/CorC family transporter [Chitinophagales bacterium]|nr:HlyC/CorC family transporter [Chitinophagales bacterium]